MLYHACSEQACFKTVQQYQQWQTIFHTLLIQTADLTNGRTHALANIFVAIEEGDNEQRMLMASQLQEAWPGFLPECQLAAWNIDDVVWQASRLSNARSITT